MDLNNSLFVSKPVIGPTWMSSKQYFRHPLNTIYILITKILKTVFVFRFLLYPSFRRSFSTYSCSWKRVSLNSSWWTRSRKGVAFTGISFFSASSMFQWHSLVALGCTLHPLGQLLTFQLWQFRQKTRQVLTRSKTSAWRH